MCVVMFKSFLSIFKYPAAKEKVDDAFYEYFSHHWSANYNSPHIPTILAMSVVTLIPLNDEIATTIVGAIKEWDEYSN